MLVFVDVRSEVLRHLRRRNRSRGSRCDGLDDVMEEHLETFEPPASEERVLRFDQTDSTDAVVDRVRAYFRPLDAPGPSHA